jgi:hypothetical protein
MELNLSNGIAVYGRISDLLGLALVAFNNEVDWFDSNLDASSAAGAASGSSFVFFLVI